MSNDLFSTIHMICDYMKTEYKNKKHGGYNVYKDTKIELLVDTYVPNIRAYIIDENKKEQLVLLRNHSGFNQVYHPGKWESYILSLREQAIKAKNEYKIKQELRKKKEHEHKFGDVSDELNAIFN